MTKVGRDYLIRNGWETEQKQKGSWEKDDEEEEERLAFVWSSKSGPQFDTNDEKAAHIRPYPKNLTDCLDDKMRLAKALQSSIIAPKCIASPQYALSNRLYFVKQCYGAQEKSVYVYNKVLRSTGKECVRLQQGRINFLV